MVKQRRSQSDARTDTQNTAIAPVKPRRAEKTRGPSASARDTEDASDEDADVIDADGDAFESDAHPAEEDDEPGEDDVQVEDGDIDVSRLPLPVQGGASLARYDALQAYMRDVHRYQVLDAESQRDLAVRYREQGDVDAARKLVTSNLRLVVKIAYDYRRAYRNVMDLIRSRSTTRTRA